MPRDTLMCGWGVHTPKNTARSSGPLSWLGQHGKSQQRAVHPTRHTALIVHRAPRSRQWGSPSHGTGGSLHVIYYTRKTDVLESLAATVRLRHSCGANGLGTRL